MIDPSAFGSIAGLRPRPPAIAIVGNDTVIARDALKGGRLDAALTPETFTGTLADADFIL